jgi:hypothetical protein
MRFFKAPVIFKNYCLFFIVIFIHPALHAQDSLNIEFGKITIADFNQYVLKSDTGASAVIIADIGKTYFEGTNMGFLDIVFTRFMRVKIQNKNGLKIAKYEIGFYNNPSGYAEPISDLKGSTFNLENGVIKETKLDASSIFDEKYNKYFSIKKFAMPALKEGSIYDITYTVRSQFDDHLTGWDFQSEYPCNWSEYQVTVPSSYHYKMKLQGDQQFDINTNKTVFENFSIQSGFSGRQFEISGNSSQVRWVKKNVPAFKRETYVCSVKNYIDRVSFQLEYFQFNKKEDRHDYFISWAETGKKYFMKNNLEESIESENYLMDKEIPKITAKAHNTDQISRAIYCFVRDNFTCTNHNGIFPQNALKEIYKNRSGTEAEINLLLIAMLRHVKIYAEPAILSTRDNGFASVEFPLLDEYNYLICVMYDYEKEIKLDASRPRNPYGNLLSECYNGGARILNESNPRFIPLSPDSLVETKQTNVIIANDEKGEISGGLSTTFGAERSYEMREEIRKTSKDDYFKNNLEKTGSGISIIHEDFDSLDNYTEPLKMNYDFEFNSMLKQDVIYFKPVLGSSMNSNPFTAGERRYPVEMPSKMDNVYLLSMDIPKGFQVDDLPKSSRIKLGENEGIFEYIIQLNPDNIQMQVHLKLNKANFPVEEYASLREFFNYVVKKENEQIVFKKIH